MSAGVSLITLSVAERTLGSDELSEMISRFACPLNRDVEDYLKNPKRAINSSRMSSSVSYLVLDSQTSDLLGYFTLMMKAYSVESSQLSSKNRRLVERFSEVDKQGKLVVPVYLIAQLGKNFALPKEKQIAGVDLLKLAIDRFSRVRGVLGGKLVMVEREADCPKLQEFYTKNGFKSWTHRINEKDGKKKVEFDQMFAVLNDEPPTGGPGS